MFLESAFLFLAVAFVAFFAFQWLFSERAALDKRLAQEEDEGEPRMVFGELTPALAGQSPTLTAAKREALEQELRSAGYYRPTAFMEYRAIRAVLVLAPIFLALGFALLVERPYVMTVLIVGLIVAILGYSLPRIYLNFLGNRRLADIRRGLPVAVDLLGLGLSAGQNINTALQRTAQQIQLSFPDLAYELQIVIRQAQLNTLPHALEQFADRVDIQEVRNLAVLINQAQSIGADPSTALMEFAAGYRTNLRHRAEAQANRASFWMLFPSILCLWIPAGIILLGPVFFEFRNQRDIAAKAMKGDLKGLQELRDAQKKKDTPSPLDQAIGETR